MTTINNRYQNALNDCAGSLVLLKEAKAKLVAASEAATILQTVASNVQRCWYEHLGRIVSKCIAAVFEDPYEFKLVFKQLANRTQIQFLFERNLEEFDPLYGTGGGVVDIASFGLRIAALLLSVHGQRKLLVADEPFRYVSVDYRPQVRLLLERLAEEFDIQIILVTHMEELEAGKVIQFSS
jgi:ABC-type antimicrobial peptide transport system ATPase subunit